MRVAGWAMLVFKKKKQPIRVLGQNESFCFSSSKPREMRRGIKRLQEGNVTTGNGQQQTVYENKENIPMLNLEEEKPEEEKKEEINPSHLKIEEAVNTQQMVAEATNKDKMMETPITDTVQEADIRQRACEEALIRAFRGCTKKEMRKQEKEIIKEKFGSKWKHIMTETPLPPMPYQSRSKYYYQKKKKQKTWQQIIEDAAGKNAIVIGESIRKKPVCISTQDMYKPVFIDGKTGTGKTTLMAQMILQHIMQGHNIFVISPHPDLIYENILPYLPENIKDNIVIINPADAELPIRFNLFDIPNRETLEREGKQAQLEKMKELVITDLFNMFKRIWGTWGPLLEKNLTFAFQAALSIPNTTMIDVHWILTNWEKRYRMINMLDREELRDFFLYEMREMQYEDISSARVRIGKFAMSDTLKAALCCRDNPVHMIDMVQPGKIVFIDLNEKNLGVENMRILGIIYITQLWMAVIAQKGFDIMDRKTDGKDTHVFPTFLFVDEFQNFAAGSFQDMLSEARKYRFGIVMATQYLKQVEENMRNSIIANVGTPISFFVGVDDAQIMSRWLSCKERFLTDLDPYQYLTRTIVGNKTTRWFWGRTYQPPGKPRGWLGKVQNFALISRQNHGRPYDPANTSLFGGDVQETQDLLLAIYSLMLETHIDSYDGLSLHRRIEEISHLPGLIKDYTMSKLLNTALSLGYIEIDTVKTPEEILKKMDEKDGWKKVFYKIFYKMTVDGEIALGIREISSSMGAGGAVGGDKHKNLLMRMLRSMAERSINLRIIRQGGSSTKPDAEIFTMPNKAGRKATDIQSIEKAIQNSWIYQQTKGQDVNVEVECTTLMNPPKIHRNLAKGIAQERMVFFVVENNEDAYRLNDILAEFIEEGYKGYAIDADKGFRDNYLARKPNYNDYRVFIVGDDRLKGMDNRTGRIYVVETIATMEIPSESYELWKTLHPMLYKTMILEKHDPKITLNEIYEIVHKENPNVTMEGMAETLKRVGMMSEKRTTEELKAEVCSITEKDLRRIEVTLNEIEMHMVEEKKILEEENRIIQHTLQLLRKKMGESEKTVFENTGDIARKLNIGKPMIKKMLRILKTEPNTLDGSITIRAQDIPTETVLNYLLGFVGINAVKWVTVDDLVDVLGMDRKNEIIDFLEKHHKIFEKNGNVGNMVFEKKTLDGKTHYMVNGSQLRKTGEAAVDEGGTLQGITPDTVDFTRCRIDDGICEVYCKQLPGTRLDTVPMGFEELKKDWGGDERFGVFLIWSKKKGFMVDDNQKMVAVDKSKLEWEETKETPVDVKIIAAPATSEQGGKGKEADEAAPAASKQDKQEEKKKKAGGRPKKQIDVERIIQMKKDGKSVREIAEEAQVSIGLISNILKEYAESSEEKT